MSIVSIEQLETVAVLGAGTMGHGIAQVCAMQGLTVRLQDINEAGLEHATQRVRGNLEKGVARGKLDAATVTPTMARLSTTTSLEAAIDGAQLIIEAVPERMEIKRQLFTTLGEKAAPGAVLATNTSSFSIGALGEVSGRPEAVIGLHFFNPVHIMKLLEIIVAEKTDAAAVSLAKGFAERLGKSPIQVKDVPGFATSRLGIALAMEAIRMLEQGVASAKDIDAAMELGYRHPMGPLKLTDLVGLDVRLDITRYLYEALGSESFKPPALLEELVAQGRLGKKVGRGFYDY